MQKVTTNERVINNVSTFDAIMLSLNSFEKNLASANFMSGHLTPIEFSIIVGRASSIFAEHMLDHLHSKVKHDKEPDNHNGNLKYLSCCKDYLSRSISPIVTLTCDMCGKKSKKIYLQNATLTKENEGSTSTKHESKKRRNSTITVINESSVVPHDDAFNKKNNAFKKPYIPKRAKTLQQITDILLESAQNCNINNAHHLIEPSPIQNVSNGKHPITNKQLGEVVVIDLNKDDEPILNTTVLPTDQNENCTPEQDVNHEDTLESRSNVYQKNTFDAEKSLQCTENIEDVLIDKVAMISDDKQPETVLETQEELTTAIPMASSSDDDMTDSSDEDIDKIAEIAYDSINTHVTAIRKRGRPRKPTSVTKDTMKKFVKTEINSRWYCLSNFLQFGIMKEGEEYTIDVNGKITFFCIKNGSVRCVGNPHSYVDIRYIPAFKMLNRHCRWSSIVNQSNGKTVKMLVDDWKRSP
jgi:hypothetical protein